MWGNGAIFLTIEPLYLSYFILGFLYSLLLVEQKSFPFSGGFSQLKNKVISENPTALL